MYKNYDKLNLGITLNGLDGSHFGDDCHNYGSIGGCDENCPVLIDIKCSLWKENINLLDEELIELYKSLEPDEIPGSKNKETITHPNEEYKIQGK